MRIFLLAALIAAPAAAAPAAMSREQALKHYGAASAAASYCRNINEPLDSYKKIQALGLDTDKDFDDPVYKKARSEQLRKFNEATPDTLAAECKKIYDLYGPKGTAIPGYYTDPG